MWDSDEWQANSTHIALSALFRVNEIVYLYRNIYANLYSGSSDFFFFFFFSDSGILDDN